MPSRGTLLVAVIACAIAIPYLQDPSGGGFAPVREREWWGSLFTEVDEDFPPNTSGRETFPVAQAVPPSGYPQTAPWMPRIPPPAAATATSMPAPQFQSLAQIFRFDVSPEWVTSTWPLVSTRVREDDLSGMRLPLVSGMRAQDIAGALTYWFNPQRQCDRIDFWGTAGDSTELVALLTQGYGLKVEPAAGGMFLVGRDPGGQPRSALRIRPGRIVRSDQPHHKNEVELELQRPGSQRGVSRLFRERLFVEGVRADGFELTSATDSGSEANPQASNQEALKKATPKASDNPLSQPPPAVVPSATPNEPLHRRPDTEFLIPRSR